MNDPVAQNRKHRARFKVFAGSAVLLLLAVAAWSFYDTFARQYRDMVPVRFGGENTFASQGKWMHSLALEAPLSETAFRKYAQEQGWNVQSIQKPFKIARCTLAKPVNNYNYIFAQMTNGLPENETSDSFYHYIQKGSFYMDESEGYTVHAAYDADSGKFYFYRKVHGPGYRQAEINLLWK